MTMSEKQQPYEFFIKGSAMFGEVGSYLSWGLGCEAGWSKNHGKLK